MVLGVSDYVTIAGFVFQVVATLVGGAWVLGRANARIAETFREELDKHKADTTKGLDEVNKILVENELSAERRVGEVGAALRSKITEFELFVRDHYVRRDTFQEMVKMMSTSVQSQFARLEASINRLSDKFDQLLAGRNQQG